MRETFVNPPPILTSFDEVHCLEEGLVVIPLAMTNLLQDNVYKREDDMEENEELTTSYANSEPSLHNAPITPAENTGNAHGPTLMEGENCLNVLNFYTNHAIIEQLLVESSLDLSLSHDNLLDVPCDKDELVDDASVFQVLEPITYVKRKRLLPIGTEKKKINYCILQILWVILSLILYMLLVV
jgi:hypothetical protein